MSVRFSSLDWARGWLLVATVLANSILVMPAWFDHAPWDGVHPFDLLFPAFVTLSGCGLAFALHRRVALLPLLRRVLVLFAAGLLYNAITHDSWEIGSWTTTGVLQLYAILIAVIGLIHLITRSWIGWTIVTLVFTLCYTVLLAVWATGCPDGVLAPACNPSGVVDVAVFGAPHIYHEGAWGYDPVGLVATLGALISASAGATVGHLMLGLRKRPEGPASGRRRLVEPSPAAAIVPLLVVAAALVVLAQLTIVIPEWLTGGHQLVMKRLWTPPFALRVAAGVTVGLLVGHLLLDRRRVARWLEVVSYPVIALGRNSLLVYFGVHIQMAVLTRPIVLSPADSGGASEVVLPISPARAIAESIAIGGHVQLTWTFTTLAFWVLLASALHRGRIYLRA